MVGAATFSPRDTNLAGGMLPSMLPSERHPLQNLFPLPVSQCSVHLKVYVHSRQDRAYDKEMRIGAFS